VIFVELELRQRGAVAVHGRQNLGDARDVFGDDGYSLETFSAAFRNGKSSVLRTNGFLGTHSE
jgi:hypothetical protein